MTFAKNIDKSFGKDISNISVVNAILDCAKQSAADELKPTSKRINQKTEEAVRDFICNKITYRITNVSKTSY